jgi:NADH dehydrogenase
MTARREARGGTLILGGGFAGASVARRLGRRGATIICPENFLLFTPMLPEAAAGTIEPRHVVVPLRLMCPHAALIVGRAVGLDEATRTVRVEAHNGPLEVGYEQLVLALGSVPRTLPIPGLAEHALGLKSLADAIHLRNHVLRRLEAADCEGDPACARRHLTFVFVGAGYSGVKAMGQLMALVRDALAHYPDLRGVSPRAVLVEAAPRILPEASADLADYAARRLRASGVDVRTSTRLAAVERGLVTLSDGTRIEADTLVWTAGARAHPLLEEFGLPTDDRGRVRADAMLRVEGRDRLWALGDCARVPNAATPDHPDPPTAQHALMQAIRLAANLRGEPAPYRYRLIGQVATLGHYRGIADVLGMRFRGPLGWFISRWYDLYQLPLMSRRLRVMADWAAALVLGRDIAELGMLGHPAPLPSAEVAGGSAATAR